MGHGKMVQLTLTLLPFLRTQVRTLENEFSRCAVLPDLQGAWSSLQAGVEATSRTRADHLPTAGVLAPTAPSAPCKSHPANSGAAAGCRVPSYTGRAPKAGECIPRDELGMLAPDVRSRPAVPRSGVRQEVEKGRRNSGK